MNLYDYHSNPKKLFGHESPHLMIKDEALRYLRYDNPDAETKAKLEKFISDDAYKSYMYALHTGERFPLAEPTIATDPEYSLQYALAIKQPFKLGEKTIATNALASLRYAKLVLHDRFVAGEKAIAKSGWLDDYVSFLRSIGRPTKQFEKMLDKQR